MGGETENVFHWSMGCTRVPTWKDALIHLSILPDVSDPLDGLMSLHSQMGRQAAAIIAAKKSDYAGDDDLLRNFRLSESMGLCTTPQGILVRLTDKLSRLASFSKKGSFEVNESVEDTVKDLINYKVLFLAALKDC